MSTEGTSPGGLSDTVLATSTDSALNDTTIAEVAVITVPGPNTDDDSLKLRLLVPHIALASFLILLALASFIHYHITTKESKADGKFTEQLKSKLRRNRAAQGFPSTLVQYFGLGALNRETFDFTAYLNRIGHIAYYQQQKQQNQQNNHQTAPPSMHTVAPSGAGQGTRPYVTPSYYADAARYGLANLGFVEDEFAATEYGRRGAELTMSPMSLVDSPLTPHRDAGSFQTNNNKSGTPEKAPSRPGYRGKFNYRVALNPGRMHKN